MLSAALHGGMPNISGFRSSPFPVMPDRAAENLRREAIAGEIFITGNTAIDAMKTTVRPDFQFTTPELNALDFAGRRIITLTCHRRENYGKPMEDIM